MRRVLDEIVRVLFVGLIVWLVIMWIDRTFQIQRLISP